MIRIEIHLEKEEVKLLDAIAKSEGRSRKNFCETEIKKRITAVAVRQKRSKNIA